MFFTEVKFHITPPSEDIADALIAALGEVGFDSFSYTEDGFNAYIPSPNFTRETIEQLAPLPFFQQHYQITWETSEIENQDWNKVWEENFTPIVVQGKILVRAGFHETIPGIPHEIIIDPKMSFGTGHHATTALMLETILELTPEIRHKRVLDMGCGTGILSILASQVGAASVTGIDIDEWAYRNAQENLATNHIQNVSIRIGDARLLESEAPYNVILANINRNILWEDMPAYVKALHGGGLLIISGFYLKDLPFLQQRAETLGLYYVSHKTESEWTAAVFKQK